MPFDSWLDDEDPPESRWGDPERDLPNVPEAPSPSIDEADVDPEILQTFWLSVVLANVALLGVCLGPMLIYFRGMWVVGAASVGVGLLAFFRVSQHARAFQERHGDEENTADDDATPDDDAGRNA